MVTRSRSAGDTARDRSLSSRVVESSISHWSSTSSMSESEADARPMSSVAKRSPSLRHHNEPIVTTVIMISKLTEQGEADAMRNDALLGGNGMALVGIEMVTLLLLALLLLLLLLLLAIRCLMERMIPAPVEPPLDCATSLSS